MGSRVEQFEQIRRDRDREGLSIRALAERHGVHRRAVRQALASAVPPAKRVAGEPAGAEAGSVSRDDRCVAGGRPRRRRASSATRPSGSISAWSMSTAPRSRRSRSASTSGRASAQLGWPVADVFVPQNHEPGAGAEVDWGQAEVDLAGERVTVHLFVMRASFSGAAFCQASPVETQQAFLELHVEAFEWFGGVFAQIRYDNLKSAVKKVLKGRRRVEADRFVALRSHYLFASEFTTPGLEGAHEKGGVEGEVGRFRRNHLVPVPLGRGPRRAQRAAARGLRSRSRSADRRAARRRSARRWAIERPLLRALPAEPFDCARGRGAAGRSEGVGHDPPEPLLGPGRPGRAEGLRARRRARDHDQPRRPAWSRATSGCTASSPPAPSSITTSSCCAASPARLEHSVALAQERDRGAWPACFDELWAALTERYGRSDAARADGRRRAALPRARPRARRSSRSAAR